MPHPNRYARVNTKVLGIMIVVTIALGMSLVVARQVRRSILSERALTAAEAAYEKKDWLVASRQYQEYLGRNPDDIAVLRKYGHARLSVRPLEAGHLTQAIAAYRRVIQLDSVDSLAYEKLATIYAGVGNFEELAYIARTRLEHAKDDRKAVIWLADALIRLNREKEAQHVLDVFIAEVRGLPGKHSEYIEACERRSRIAANASPPDLKVALDVLTEAVDYDPNSPAARAQRARFYRVTPDIPKLSAQEVRELARSDLEVAGKQDTVNPRIRLFLAAEWMEHGELVRKAVEEQRKAAEELRKAAEELRKAMAAALRTAAAQEQRKAAEEMLKAADEALRTAAAEEQRKAVEELLKVAEEMLKAAEELRKAADEELRKAVAEAQRKAADELQATADLAPEVLEEHFFDINDWKIAKFLVASELALRTQDMAKAASMADEVLVSLTERRHRAQVLTAAVRVYIAANKIPEAGRCLDECLDIQYVQDVPAEFKVTLAYLQALVARAERKPYLVINALQPLVVTDTSRPELWRLLAEAYSQTDQPRRAITALLRYLRYDPENPEMMLQLAKEYLKLQDWNHAYQTARLAEPLNPVADIVLTLLRIEASVYIEAERSRTPDPDMLRKLESELADLRKDHPERVDIRLLQAIIANYLGDPDRAERELNLAIEECEEPVRAEMELVKHYYRTKRMDEAIDACQKACERHAGLAEPWLTLSMLHGAAEDQDAARRSLQKGLESVSDSWEKRSLQMALATFELASGNAVEGRRLLAAIAADNPHEIRARTLLLYALLTGGGQEGLAMTAERTTEIQAWIDGLKTAEGESGLQWRLYQAWLWLSGDDWRSRQQDIVSHLQYCIDADPEWTHPTLLLAGMYDLLEDSRRVEDICRQALTRNPSATDVADRLVRLLEEQGRFADAEKVLHDTQADARTTSAWNVRLALRTRDFSRAIEELRLRIAADERDASSRVLLARLLYWQTRDAQQAQRYLNEAEAIRPHDLALVATRVAILRAEGQADDAQRVLDEYVAARKDFGAYMIRAAFLAAEGDAERAERDYRQLTSFAGRAAAGYELLSDYHIRRNDLDKAVAVLEEGLVANPDDARMNLVLKRRLMRVLFVRASAGDRAEALAILTELEQRLPNDPELLKLRAMALLSEPAPTPQTIQTARVKLEAATKLEPTGVDAHLALIRLAQQSEQYEAARDYAIQAIASIPNSPQLILARSRAEFALGNTRMATELIRMALEKDPNSTDPAAVLVEAAQDSQDPNSLLREARSMYDSALARHPADERALLSWAHVLIALRQPQAAIARLKAYCETDEGRRRVPALVTLADLYRLSGDMDQAWQWIARAEQVDPSDQSVVHARFLCLDAQGRFAELAGIGSAYISAKQQNPSVVLAAASRLAAIGSKDLQEEGIRLFQHAVTLTPTSVPARIGLASSLYQAGRIEEAEPIYQELLRQRPNDIRVLNDLAWILQDYRRDYAKALELANKGLGLARSDDRARPHLLDTRGTILSKMPDRLADAQRDFAELVRLAAPDSPQQAAALLQLARVCVKLNDLDQARQHAAKALAIDRKTPAFTAGQRAELTEISEKR